MEKVGDEHVCTPVGGTIRSTGQNIYSQAKFIRKNFTLELRSYGFIFRPKELAIGE